MYILGIHTGHDAGACLFADDTLLAFCKEERLNRIKNDGGFFRLQSVGGPVYLSQIGYVGAAVGLVSGMLFLGEHYRLLTWIGALIIVAGVLMTTRAQK